MSRLGRPRSQAAASVSPADPTLWAGEGDAQCPWAPTTLLVRFRLRFSLALQAATMGARRGLDF